MVLITIITAFSFFSTAASYGSSNFSKIIFPLDSSESLFNISELSQLEISEDCKIAIKHYVKGLSSSENWAVQMFDAGSKIPSGVYSGNLVDLGFFEQCLDVKTVSDEIQITGKYCLGGMSFSPNFDNVDNKSLITLQLSTCLPSSCSAVDMEILYNRLSIPMKFNEDLCQTNSNKPQLQAGDIGMLVFFIVTLCLILISTSYDVAASYFKYEPVRVFLSFSILTNGKALLATSGKSNNIICIDGVRALSMMWVILNHKSVYLRMLPLRNSNYVYSQFMYGRESLLLQNSPRVVDTFFLIGGIVLVYSFMNSSGKGKKFNLLKFYVHRYLRLTPLMAVGIAFYLTLLQHYGSGPFWPLVKEMFVTSCQKYWWKNLLLIHNFYENLTDICMRESWYVAVDFQLFLISPIILLPLRKWPRTTLILVGCLLGCSILSVFLAVWFLETSQFGDNSLYYYKYDYCAPWSRCRPWLIGITVGYYIFKMKEKKSPIAISKILVFSLWLACFVLLYTCVFEGMDVINGEYNKVSQSFYISFIGPAWSVAVSWVIFACCFGYAGPIDWFLSLPVFQILSKLTYPIYLCHVAILTFTIFQTRVPLTHTYSQILYTYWGDYMYTIGVSLFLTVAFEMPISVIESIIFSGHWSKKIKLVPS